MPKRPCPFEANLLPQMKVHVGQKQIDNGVSKDERMKDVYGKIFVLFSSNFNSAPFFTFFFILRNLLVVLDSNVLCSFNILFLLNFLDKTLALLRTGAKALSHKLNASAQIDSIDLSSLSPHKLKSTSNLKQMLLTDKLQLKLSDKIINVSYIYTVEYLI